MRKLLFLAVLAFLVGTPTHGQGTQIATFAADPATCRTGMVYYNSMALAFKSCGPDNTWTTPGGSATWSGLTPGTNSNAGTFAMSGNTLDLSLATFNPPNGWFQTDNIANTSQNGLNIRDSTNSPAVGRINVSNTGSNVDMFDIANIDATPGVRVATITETTPLQGDLVAYNGSGVKANKTPGVPGRTVAGTSDTINCAAGGDRGNTVTYTSNSAVAVTLGNAATTCGSNFYVRVNVTGTGGVTITPTTSTINFGTGPQTSMVISKGTSNQAWADISSPDNLNYIAMASNSGGGTLQVINSFPVTSGLLAQYAMNEGTGTTLTDLSGNGNNGTLASGNNAPLWLGGSLNPLAMDAFVQSGGTLNSNWTTIDGTFAVASNAVKATALGTLASARFTAIPWNIPSTQKVSPAGSLYIDQYACTTAVTVPTGATGIGPAVRLDTTAPPNTNYYALEWQGPGTNSFRLYKRQAGAFTALNVTAGTYNVGDQLCLQAVGGVLTFTKNGVNIASPVTDTNMTIGFPGIAASGVTGTSGTVGNWQGGTVTPSTSGLLFGGAQFVTLPSALNSAQTMQVYACYQKSQNPNATNALIQGNGNGANSNANGIHLAENNAANGTNVAQTLPRVQILGGSAYTTAGEGLLNGCGVVSASFGTSGTSLDQTYINNVEHLYNISTRGAAAGLQTVGAYQIGGAASGSGFSSASFYTGQQYYWLFYNRKLTNAEIFQNVRFLTDQMSARGVSLFSGNVQAGKGSCVVSGDSIMAGKGLSAAQAWTENITLTNQANGETWDNTNANCWNQGVSSATEAEINRVGSTFIDPLFSPSSTRNVAIIAGCSNDLFFGSATAFLLGSAPACVAQQAADGRARRAAGWKVLAATIISRRYSAACDGDSQKDLINPLIRQEWPTYADGLVDLGETLTLGADGACTSANFSDFIHPSATGTANTMAPLFQHAIDRLVGPQDFSQANVYNAAAPAAVATTAGTSNIQIATVTFGAVPCASGQTITIAGVTPAGYNGTFLILPGSTATVLTYTTPGSNLGNITVQGTGVCPQQRSQDKYMVINFGAGNFTLDTCAGYTGQNIYIRNINAAASTLVPLGSETITGGGAAPTTLAAASTAILQSQLVSNTAGGCNWVRLQ